MKKIATKVQTIFMLCFLSALTQGCSNKFEVLNSTSGTPVESVAHTPGRLTGNALVDRTTALHWNFSTGSVAPAYYYVVDFQIDLLGKTRSVTVDQGSSVRVTLPPVGIRNLTDGQLAQIRLLLSRVSFNACDPGDGLTGGGLIGGRSDVMNIITSSGSVPELTLHGENCFGLSTAGNAQAVGGYQELVDYLSTL